MFMGAHARVCVSECVRVLQVLHFTVTGGDGATREFKRPGNSVVSNLYAITRRPPLIRWGRVDFEKNKQLSQLINWLGEIEP